MTHSDDDRLKALFAADLPPHHDPDFQTGVLAAVMRRRFLGELSRILAVSLVGGFILAVLWPSLSPLLAGLGQSLAPAAIAVTLAITILALTSGRDLGLTA